MNLLAWILRAEREQLRLLLETLEGKQPREAVQYFLAVARRD